MPSQDVAEVCGVSSMPTFAFYRSSKPIHGFVGADTRRLQTDYAKLLSGGTHCILPCITSRCHAFLKSLHVLLTPRALHQLQTELPLTSKL